MQSEAFLRFIKDYSYPIEYYSFLSAEDSAAISDDSFDEEKESKFYFLSGFSAKLIHTTLQKSNFVQTDDIYQAPLVVGSKANECLQKYLSPYQRMTHYLYTQVIGQKVGLHRTLSKFMNTTHSSLPFYPKTFLIPQEMSDFQNSLSMTKFWIEKPCSSSCGRGITIVEGIPDKFIARQVIMQEYIRNPLLIHGYKFDLRFYVAVTSLNPLRIYNYNDGLVRFATEKYALFFEDVSNLAAHLTNFSINKESNKFHVTNDIKDDGKGSKWSHVPFWPFLDALNFDVEKIKEKIDDAIATTIFAARNDLALQQNHRCSFELYGFDVLLTVDGEIHVLEVNISPALGTSSNLDMHIKAPLVRDLFNLALIPKKTDKEMRIEAAFINENINLFKNLIKKRERNQNQNQNKNENQNQKENENQNQKENENQNQKENENQNQKENENQNQKENENQNQKENENQNQKENENQNQNENENKNQNENENKNQKENKNQNQNESEGQNHNLNTNENQEKIKPNKDAQNQILQIQNRFPQSVLSDVASLASVCEFEIAEQRLGGFRRIYPTPERAKKFNEMTGIESMKTRLDLVLEDWIKSGEESKQQFIKSMLPSYRTFLGDLIDFPREYCSIQ